MYQNFMKILKPSHYGFQNFQRIPVSCTNKNSTSLYFWRQANTNS